jgi:hypothetical protein
MEPFTKAVLSACLSALRWLLWLVAALAATLLVVQYLRGDAQANGSVLAVLALGFAVGGWACGKAGPFWPTMIVGRVKIATG